MLFNEMRETVGSLMHAIYHHPFNVELAGGTLAKEKFIFYLEQDVLYLADYARALAVCSARLSSLMQREHYLQFALETLKAEKTLHQNYLNQYALLKSQQVEMAPTCFMYTRYLLSTSSLSSVEEAAASLLPCFTVYRDVGKKMLETSQWENNPYQDWITLYSSEAFDASVQSAIQIVNELGHNASESMRKKMISAYFKATQLEWMFWDAAYHLETWKISHNTLVEGINDYRLSYTT